MTIAGLATTRQTILNSFKNGDTEATDLVNMDKLNEVEAQIEKATFDTDANKLAGLLILFELNDAPDFADNFKAKLFKRIHEFA